MFEFLDGRKCALSALLPVQGNDEPRDFCTGSRDNLVGLAHGRAGRDDVIDDEHIARQRGADDAAALTVRFGFFAIERVRHVNVVMLGERCRGQRRQRDALVGRTKQHVEANVGLGDRGRVVAPQLGRGVAGVEETGVEKVRAGAPGFQREFTEPQYTEFECQFDEFSFVATHAIGLLYDCRFGAEYDIGDRICFAL